MEIPIALTGETPEITVLLSDQHSDEYKPFRCVACGNWLFNYNNDHIRSIIPSGHPKLDKPGHVIRCNGSITLRGNRQIYDLLYSIMDTVFNSTNIEQIRDTIGLLNANELMDNKINTKCRALYFIS